MTKSQYVAWVAFRGRKPGVYYSWEECDEQIKEFPKAKYHAFETVRGADLAWEEWQRKIATKFTASARPAPQNLARRGQESLDPVPTRIQPSAAKEHGLSKTHERKPSTSVFGAMAADNFTTSTIFYDPPPAGPLMPGNSNFQRAADNQIYYPQLHIQNSIDCQASYSSASISSTNFTRAIESTPSFAALCQLTKACRLCRPYLPIPSARLPMDLQKNCQLHGSHGGVRNVWARC